MTAVISYTDRAVQLLNKVGILVKAESDAPIMRQLDAIAELDTNRVMAIARTLQQQSAFNAVVREQMMGMEVSNRQSKIVAAFDSIRTDMEQMVVWLDDGKVDFIERIKMGWMTLVRGSIPDRFAQIKKTYLEIAKDSGEQIEREHIILNAYRDFRFGLKQAQVDAHEVIKVVAECLEQRKEALGRAIKFIEEYQGTDDAERSRLELARDEALQQVQKEDNRYQIVLDLANNLTVAYNAAEAVFARLQQTSSVKERIYQQSINFFSTNEIVFTALSASITSLTGLEESTKTLEAMKEGMNRSLESIANNGSKKLEAGLKAGYGSTLKAESLRALVDSIVNYQETSYKLIEELRIESTNNVKEIDNIVEDGKRRFVEVITKANVQ